MPPAVTGIAIVSEVPTGQAAYGIGDTVEVELTFNEDVLVTGSPTIELMVIGTTRTMTYMANGDSTKMGFEWEVVEGAQDDDGVSVPAADIVLNSGTITDLVGNPGADPLSHPELKDDLSHPVDAVTAVEC